MQGDKGDTFRKKDKIVLDSASKIFRIRCYVIASNIDRKSVV